MVPLFQHLTAIVIDLACYLLIKFKQFTFIIAPIKSLIALAGVKDGSFL